ncbi:MAG: NusG domain II-containing protein [Clostridiales bacterium]|nr:NusG domain II-containing protein [Clostridiales bacterium]
MATQPKRRYLKRADGCLAAGAALLAALLLWGLSGRNGAVTAYVYQDGNLMQSYRLEQAQQEILELEDTYHAVIAVENGGIRYESCDCPSQVCVRTGELRRAGQSAACVPGRTMIVLDGAGDEKLYETY